MQSRFFQARDGVRLHYIVRPSRAASSTSYCILLHGFTNDAHVWDRIAEVLQQSHHVVALDHRGHGDSDWDPQASYSHWQLAEDLLALLDEEFLAAPAASIHCVGHSLGARVAMLALAQCKRKIASLTLVDAGPEVGAEAGERLVTDLLQLPESYPDLRSYREAIARLYVMADAQALAHVTSFGLRMRQGRLRPKTDPRFTPGIWHKTPELQAQYRERGTLEEQLWKALRSLAMPVHLVRGQASSILTGPLASKMTRMLGKSAQLSVVSRAGHAVMLDNPAASETLIVDYINRISQEQKSSSNAPALRQKKLEYP